MIKENKGRRELKEGWTLLDEETNCITFSFIVFSPHMIPAGLKGFSEPFRCTMSVAPLHFDRHGCRATSHHCASSPCSQRNLVELKWTFGPYNTAFSKFSEYVWWLHCCTCKVNQQNTKRGGTIGGQWYTVTRKPPHTHTHTKIAKQQK